MSDAQGTEQMRPESFDDLPKGQYDTEPKQIASIVIDMNSIGTGLLAATEQVIIAFRAVYGDTLVVSIDGGRVTATRPLTGEEKAEVLDRHQRRWDDRRKQEAEAEKRAHLKVGDPIELEAPVTCRTINKVDCDLSYEHTGDHFKVTDGLVVRRTKRMPR